MEEPGGSGGDDPGGGREQAPRSDPARVAEARARLKQLAKRWASERDSEQLWEAEHALLLVLAEGGDARTVEKFAKVARRALGGRPSPKDLADAALGLWVLGRYDEAADVLRAAVERLPANRYPWDLLLRHMSARGPNDGIAFIEASLERVPWSGYALTQLGARHLDAASRALVGRDSERCRASLAGARRALERACGERDLTTEMRASCDRLLALVGRLEQRLERGQAATSERALMRLFGQVPDEQTKLAEDVKVVAEVAGVSLEGEPDPNLDLDEVERAALAERPEEEREPTITVVKVTPVPKSTLRSKKEGRAPPEGDQDPGEWSDEGTP